MNVTDTTRTAQQVQVQIHRAMSREQRLLLAIEMTQFARELAKQRIREEHPDWTSREVTRELVRFAFLPELLPAALR